MLNVAVADALPLALPTVTSNVCEPTVKVLFAPDVQAAAAAASHVQVVVVASVAVHVAASGVVQIVPLSGFVIFTVGAFSTVKLLDAVALPAALDAFTLKVCCPVESAFAGGDAGHGFCQVPLSHQQTIVVAPVVEYAGLTGATTFVAPFAGDEIVAVGSAPTVKVLTTVVVPLAFVAATVKEWLPGARVFKESGDVGHGLSTASASHWQVTEVAPAALYEALTCEA